VMARKEAVRLFLSHKILLTVGGLNMAMPDLLVTLGALALCGIVIRGFWGATRIPRQDPFRGNNGF
jgi:hypothetical protein